MLWLPLPNLFHSQQYSSSHSCQTMLFPPKMSNNYYQASRDGSANANNQMGALQEVSSASSLNSRSAAYNPLSEIQHSAQLVEQISGLYLDEACSDLTLIAEDQRLPAHRVVLAARSTYFRAMLYGGLRETNEREVVLIDTPAEAFKALLKYIYTGRLQLKTLDFHLVLDMLGLVHKYGFAELESAIPEYLKSTLKNKNVCAIFTVAHHYSIECLMAACLDFIDNCASEVLGSQPFLELPAQALVKVLKRNSFCAPELEIFEAVQRWIEAHPNEKDLPKILTQIRLTLIKMDDLFGPVRDSGLISADQILDAIKDQNTLRTSQLKYRGFLFPGTNIATPVFGAKVITGDFRTALLANQNNEDEGTPTDRTYAKHLINPRDSGITIELGRPFIVNNIRLHLMDRDQRAYSYYIEVSMDRSDWVRVINHTNHLCRSKQNLFFEERVVKYIRIVGTHSSVNNTFQLGNFEALFTLDNFEIDVESTLQIPRQNVAKIQNNAIVIEGVSRSRNALLNGDTTNYDWDNGYTCHQLGSGALVVQLPQPYLIETMRLLLWDCDDRCYSFYIEVSGDQNKWTKVAEFSECRGWQIVHFDLLPVVFVRIVGTFNSANEVFHCVHFECPAMESNTATEEERLKRLRQANSSNSAVNNPSSPSSGRASSQTLVEGGTKKDEEEENEEMIANISIPVVLQLGEGGERGSLLSEEASDGRKAVGRSKSEPASTSGHENRNQREASSLPSLRIRQEDDE